MVITQSIRYGLAAFVFGGLFLGLLPAAEEPASKPAWKGKPAEHWTKQLSSKDVAERREAVKALASIGSGATAAIKPLLAAVKDDDSEVRLGAIQALGQIGPDAKEALPALLNAAKDREVTFQDAALEALGRIGVNDARVVTVLAEAALTAPPRGSGATRGLKAMGPRAKGAIPVLEKGLNNVAVIDVLGSLGTDAIPLLKKASEQESTVLKVAALRSLGNVGPDGAKEAIPLLKKHLEEKDGGKAAAEALANLGADGVPVLIEALKSSNVDTACEAARQLGKKRADAKAAVPALIESLYTYQVNPRLPRDARFALVQIGPDAVPSLLDALKKTKEPGKRLSIVAVFHDSRSPEAVPALIALLKDKDIGSRINETVHAMGKPALLPLVAALEDLDNEQAVYTLTGWKKGANPYNAGDLRFLVPNLVKLLKNEEPEIRKRACQVLGSMGPQASTAREELEAAKNDKIPSVRRAAAQAIEQIEGTPKNR